MLYTETHSSAAMCLLLTKWTDGKMAWQFMVHAMLLVLTIYGELLIY